MEPRHEEGLTEMEQAVELKQEEWKNINGREEEIEKKTLRLQEV